MNLSTSPKGILRKHLPAWIVLFSVAVIIGCGSGGDIVFRGSERVTVQGLELHERVRVVPSDGSVVVTSIGERGIQFTGDHLGNVQAGDYLVVMAPMTDQARQNINHAGGYMQLADGWHVVPRENVPSHIHTPGNADYSHFAVHIGQVLNHVVDAGPLAEEGSRTYASNQVQRHFIHSVSHAFSHAAHSVGHAVTHAATSTTHAVTHAATDVTHAATHIASDVSSAVGSAESAVSHAVSSIGPLSGVVSTLETVGVHFSEIVKAGAFQFDKAIHEVEKIAEDIEEFAEFLITGNLTLSLGEDGSFNFHMTDYKVSSEDGNASATFDGSLSFGYSETGTLKISSYVPESLSFTYDINASSSLTVTNIQGNKTIPLRTFNLEPIVIDAGIPVVVVREIDVKAVLNGTANPDATLEVDGSGSFGFSLDSHGPHVSSPKLSFGGSADFPNPEASGTVAIVVTAHMKLYDTAGPFIQVIPTQLDAVNVPASRELDLTLSSSVDVGADMDLLGYAGWSAQTNVWHESWHTWKIDY